MPTRPVAHLIDAHYQIFRAYHSVPDLRAPDGRPVGAVRGYASTLIKFLREHQPTHVAAAFDFALTCFRNRLYPDYKHGRTEAPEDLEPQFALCEAVTRALGIPVFQLEDYEADDVLASMVRGLLEEQADVVIVTRDKDLGALVSRHVCLLDLKEGARSGPAEVEAKLGVPPQLVTEFLALVGDAVDCIPGVPGIGAKTGAQLLKTFGGIDDIPRDVAKLQQSGVRSAARIVSSLIEHAERLKLSRSLAELCADLSLDARLSQLEYRGADRAELERLLAELGAESLLARVPRWRA